MPKEETNNDPYGEDLASLVADRLENCPLMYHHKEYSGMGLAKLSGGKFVYGEVDDGQISPSMEFGSRKELVEWLSRQTDLSLSRGKDNSFFKDNQTITKERLLRYVKYSEKSTRGDF
jgi:hypothetical protein